MNVIIGKNLDNCSPRSLQAFSSMRSPLLLVILDFAREIPSWSLRSLIFVLVLLYIHSFLLCIGEGLLSRISLAQEGLCILFYDGHGIKAGKCADQEVVCCICFVFVSIKHRDRCCFGLILVVQSHGGKYAVYEDLFWVGVVSDDGFLKIFEDQLVLRPIQLPLPPFLSVKGVYVLLDLLLNNLRGEG